MNRRALLAALAAVGGGTVAGCLTDSPGTDGERTTTTTDTTTTDGEPFRTVTVGDPDAVAFPDTHRPHVVDVVNDAGTGRDIGVRVETDGRSTGGTVTFPAHGVYRLRLVEPIDHEVVVTPPGGDPVVVPIPAGYVDCNDSRTTVTVAPDGSVRHETVSTEIECPRPAVVSRSFEAEDGECASGNAPTATVAFADGTVRVTGALRTPNPCYGAELARATLDDGTLRVVVAATDSADAVCIECVGRVDYETRVEFEHDYPDTVVVEHVVDERRREVVRTTR